MDPFPYENFPYAQIAEKVEMEPTPFNTVHYMQKKPEVIAYLRSQFSAEVVPSWVGWRVESILKFWRRLVLMSLVPWMRLLTLLLMPLMLLLQVMTVLYPWRLMRLHPRTA